MKSGIVIIGGGRSAADIFLNTAGAWVGDIAAMTGARLPVVPT